MAASFPPSNSSNRLLKLPAELRLQIYGCALHAPEGVVSQPVHMHGTTCLYRYARYRKRARQPRSSSPNPAVTAANELNQLKYVCRKMYADTKGLLVATNTLIFDHGINKFLDFVQTCPPATLKTIRHVSIITRMQPTSRIPGQTGDYAALIDFCESYPKAAVQLRHARLRPTSPDFFGHALKFNVHFRKNPGYVSKVHRGIAVQIEALTAAIEDWGAMSLDDIEPYPHNLRVYPPLGWGLEEFLERLRYNAEHIPGGEFSALLLAREIFENGI